MPSGVKGVGAGVKQVSCPTGVLGNKLSFSCCFFNKAKIGDVIKEGEENDTHGENQALREQCTLDSKEIPCRKEVTLS